MQADILREKFLSFFKSKKHKIIESDSLVPGDDPTVLFTPAGMNQFKKEFLGAASRLKRAASAQRCLRTDDLDKVGKTSGHHTFFEMLGNFSFGDYFKEEAITFAWEFLTEELKIKKEKLWVSIYKDDNEAYKIWKDKIGVSAQRIIKLGDKENFWPSEAKQKGPNGPCGECSEIFFDQGVNIGCKKPDCNPSCNCGRFVEVWNLVFTQYNRREGGILEPLPKKNIDTGMGLERLAAVMQGVTNNFETDLFQPIVKEIEAHVVRSPNKELLYAVADHIRAITFAIYDGVLPSNEGRGYVVRKLIRRSRMHLRALGIIKMFLYTLVPVLAEIMAVPYPELKEKQENISAIILAEERNCISNLDNSDTLFREKFADKPDPLEAGRIAFQLYDTYGIPLELTQDWLKKNNLKFSHEAFNRELEAQKTRSKSQSAMKGEVFASKGLGLKVKETKFLGYKDYETPAKILKIIKDNASVKKISCGDEAAIILDKTVFYAQAGGQVGDTGQLLKGKNIFQVLDTKKLEKAVIHIGRVKEGNFKLSDTLSAKADIERRLAIARNHTATHLLQAALRKVLGSHVQQQGSLVAADRLRFDFTHFKDIEDSQLDRIEELVNNYIISNYAVQKKQQTLAQAKKSGALAFFGEKYETKVRVVSIDAISKELCAGIHLDYTGAIGIFKIIQEGSVASGVRRIEALTGSSAYKKIKNEEEVISDIALILKVPQENVVAELQKRLSRSRELEKQLEGKKFDTLKTSIDNDINAKENLNGVYFITHIDDNVNSVRSAVDLIKEKVKENAVIVSTTATNLGNQVFFAIGVTLDLCDKGLDASNLIKDVAPEIGGSGGGRKDFAQAGGNKPENYKTAIQKLKEIISNLKI
jgi:alanyl-tRNA synthetase